MRPISFIVVSLVLVGFSATAQVTKSQRSSRFSVPNVSKSKAKIMCPIFVQSQYPYQGFGIKMGDPFALTYKFYPSKHWAFSADAGKTSSALYNKYYRGLFSDYIPDTLTGGRTIRYIGHKATSDWFWEGKALYQWEAESISKGLQLYAGVGWQWRKTTLRYDYLYENGPSENNFGKFSEKRFTYGPVGILGFEYAYFSLPISAFIEIEWFTDVSLDPGYRRFQGGVGLRYVFD
jgi:hypothetical protein